MVGFKDAVFEALSPMRHATELSHSAKRRPEFKSAALDRIAHIKSLLVMLLGRLELKGKKFSSFPSASEQDKDSMWEMVQEIDSAIDKNEQLTKKKLASREELTAYLRLSVTIFSRLKSVELNFVLYVDL